MSKIDIDQAKLFQTISLAVADATKQVLENEQATRIAKLDALVTELREKYAAERRLSTTLDFEKLEAEAALKGGESDGPI